MAIAQFVQHQGKRIFILGLIALLAACGGGGGGSKKDSTPDAFSFTPVTNAAVTVEVTSAAITVAGINKAAAITIANGTYSIDGGTFVSTPGTVTAGQTVSVKVITAATSNTAKVATLTIGGVVKTFSVTTAPDITPNTLVLAPTTGAALSSVNSSTVTLAGFDGALPISISAGGEYKIGSGAFTSAAGTATSGQVITVRATASASVNTAVSVTLTLGTVTGTYTVTTIPDTLAPTAQIVFPPAVSLSSGTTIKVRGTASDANSSVAGVTVNGVAAVTTDNYATWTAEVPLELGPNTLTVTATDSAANVSAGAAVSVQYVADVSNAHTPNANVLFSSPSDIVYDVANNRALVADSGLGAIISVDLLTGARTVISDSATVNGGVLFDDLQQITLDSANNQVFVLDAALKAILKVNLNTGVRTLVSDCHSAGSDTGFYVPQSLVFNTASNRIFVAEYGNQNYSAGVTSVELANGDCTVLANDFVPNANPLFEFSDPTDITLDATQANAFLVDTSLRAVVTVSLTSGERQVLSDNTTQNTLLFNSPLGIALDSAHNRALVTDNNVDTIFAVDLTSGARSILSNSTTPNSNTLLSGPVKLAVDTSKNWALVVDQNIEAIFAVDLVTGERVIISK